MLLLYEIALIPHPIIVITCSTKIDPRAGVVMGSSHATDLLYSEYSAKLAELSLQACIENIWDKQVYTR